jgi:hypothetical protein
MKTFPQYEVMRRQSCKELVEAVNSYLVAGWQLAGGVGVDIPADGGESLWYQAIMKPAESERDQP